MPLPGTHSSLSVQDAGQFRHAIHQGSRNVPEVSAHRSGVDALALTDTFESHSTCNQEIDWGLQFRHESGHMQLFPSS